MKIKRALLSVSNKNGIVEFANELVKLGVELISTGGTYSILQKNNIPVKNVSDITNFPEILDGRVKTLHPKIYGGLLSLRDNKSHLEEMQKHGINSIDLVVVNLYPFAETIAKENISFDEAMEQIDIGGPTMLRSAAKNHKFVTVIVNPNRYEKVLLEMKKLNCEVSNELRFSLAQEVFKHTSLYDSTIANYFQSKNEKTETLPQTFNLQLTKSKELRYGENPHQKAAIYSTSPKPTENLKQLHGKELSFNNIIDAQSAIELVSEFEEPTAVIIKHTNACGVGSDIKLVDAFKKAFATDTQSPFGGIFAVNRELDFETATAMNEIFSEIIIAPSFSEEAILLLQKKKDRRLIQVSKNYLHSSIEIKTISDGFIIQTKDLKSFIYNEASVVTKRKPTEDELLGLLFAFKVAKHLKSNAIVYANKDRTLGIGAGQMSRIDSSKLAVRKANEAGLSLIGSVVASDAFFPFADGLLEAIKAGATAVIQPGGSIRDNEVIQAADENNVAMIFTGIRHFKH
ncbi:MAG: bifunctional phosphoribosylaminoimidazolecarboxamide formyltransferase/IMP cyclohydrolase [Ignavibacteria bacterium]|nr:bifunctional phosphoribosylaminoimidazolecarboxamide formyltransferase/IMP cyclohydrolase [Bacteroidota bacterium]MSQ45537.1 bifunctional phosphoribosylaminoimidazolecarboxamide formyltransferase/IMP cyclohydrolase [Ignavibacteria bacterium]